MFETAARKYFLWTCGVGGGSPNIDGSHHGMGCVLDERHVLTARHCWTAISHRYSWPVVLRIDGCFRCEVIFESIPHDILVLRSVSRIRLSPDSEEIFREFKEYPAMSKKKMFLGSSVGFMSRLTLYNTVEDWESHVHFAAGFVSMILPDNNNDASRFTLSGTVIQSGFSGSPVFTADGCIVGVVVQTLRFKADPDEAKAPIYVLPVVSPMFPLFDQIESVLSKTESKGQV